MSVLVVLPSADEIDLLHGLACIPFFGDRMLDWIRALSITEGVRRLELCDHIFLQLHSLDQ